MIELFHHLLSVLTSQCGVSCGTRQPSSHPEFHCLSCLFLSSMCCTAKLSSAVQCCIDDICVLFCILVVFLLCSASPPGSFCSCNDLLPSHRWLLRIGDFARVALQSFDQTFSSDGTELSFLVLHLAFLHFHLVSEDDSSLVEMVQTNLAHLIEPFFPVVILLESALVGCLPFVSSLVVLHSAKMQPALKHSAPCQMAFDPLQRESVHTF